MPGWGEPYCTVSTVRGNHGQAGWARARDDGLLPPGCDLAWLADTTSVLAHAETYLLMRETLRMTPGRYEKWLAATWRRLAAAATQD